MFLPEAADTFDNIQDVVRSVSFRLDQPMEKSVFLGAQDRMYFCTFTRGEDPIPLKVPKCYFNQERAPNKPGILVLQDMSDFLAQRNPGPGLTANQLMQVGDALANLHAWCLNQQLGQDKYKLMDKNLFEKFPETNKIMFDKIKKSFQLFPVQ